MSIHNHDQQIFDAFMAGRLAAHREQWMIGARNALLEGNKHSAARQVAFARQANRSAVERLRALRQAVQP